MSAFLKIDRCAVCAKEIPWEWIPHVTLVGKLLVGTGAWRSTLIDGACPSCREAAVQELHRAQRSRTLRERFTRVVGGIKPYREFTFENFRVSTTNQAAFDCAKEFDPLKKNIYLWGPSGVGKTHLAVAILRHWFVRVATAAMTTPSQLIRRLRMKPPEEEQHAIDAFIGATVLVLDDVGVGGDTPYAKQVSQEILDGRDFNNRGGLVVTSQYSLNALDRRLNDRAISSRLAGMCQTIEIRGNDYRRGKGHSS